MAEQMRIDQIHVEVTGPEKGAPVVMLHGWGSSAALMRPLAQALQDTLRIYNVDLPGHGETPPPQTAWGVPDYAGLVHRLIQERIGKAVHIVGHSNGGRIALYMASEKNMAPAIKSLALISPSGVKRTRTLSYYVRSWTARLLKAPFHILPGKMKEYGLEWLRHTLVWSWLASSDYSQLKGVMRDTFVKTVNCYVEDRLGRIAVPTLLFWGTLDQAITRKQIMKFEQGIPDSALIKLDGASHYAYLDKPEVVVPALRHFLGQLSGAPRRTPTYSKS